MKNNFLKSIFISLILLVGATNAWADITFSGGYIYFDNSIGINQTYIQLCARQSSWTGVSTLSKINNTKLYYVANPQGSGWGGILGWVVIGNSSQKSNSNFDNWSSYGWCSAWNTYGFNSGSTYLIVPSSTSKSQSVTTSYYSGGYSALNSTQTIKTAVNGADANSKATITVTSYKLTGNGAISAQQSASISTSAKSTTISAARTATTTLTVGSVATGYQFDGWYTAATGGTQLSTSTTYTYYPTSATTVYARFSAKKYDITYKDQGDVTFSGTHASGYPTKHTYGTATTLSTATKTGYTFGGWHTDATCTNKVTTLGATEYTDAITLYAKWEQNAQPSITISTTQQYLQIGEDKLTLTINYTNIPEGHCYRVKVGDGYYNGNANGENNDRVSISGSGSVAFTTYSTLPGGTQSIVVELWKSDPFGATSTKSNAIDVTVEQGYQVSVYTRIGSTNTPTGTTISPTEHIGKTITATEMPGYAFTGWTSNTNNITFEDVSALSTLVYAKSGGDIYANFTKENCVYFVNTGDWNAVYAYAWTEGGDKNEEWPGEQMTKTGEKIDGHDVYKYCEPYEKIIFSNNGSNQTGDIIWEDGVTYYPNSALIKMHGNFTGEWNTTDAFAFSKDGKTATLTLTIENAKTYNFGMRIGKDDNWTSNGSSFTRAENSKAITSGNGNCNFNADITGEYTFTWTFATNTLTITYPQLVTYTVTFDMKGHGTQIEQIEVNEDSKITKPKDPTATGYTFGGWYKDANCNTEWNFNTDVVTTNTTLYAKWTATEYTITYADLQGVTHNNPTTYTIESETITFEDPTSTRTGYTFAGWNPASIAKGSTGNQTITAQWTEILSTITIVTNPAEGGSVKVDGEDFVSGNTVQVGVATTKQVTAVPNEGYGVAAWGVSNKDIVNASGGATVTLKSDGSGSTGTLYANFIGLEYTITFDKQEGTEGTDKATVRYKNNNYSVSPVVTPTRAGYTFGGYYTQDAGAGVQVVSAEGQWLANATGYTDADRKWLVKENTTLYAKWTANTYTVTLDQEGAAKKGSTTSVVANFEGNMPAITGDGALPTAQNGYAFMGYFDQKDGKGTQYYNADGTSAHVWDKVGDATLYAYLAVPKIDITLDKSTFEPGAENVTATATVTPTPAGTTTICWELLYTNDNPVENHAPSPENGNSVQFNISDLVAGTYKIKATLRMGDGCEGEEISSSEQTFLISSSHTITIKYICDGKEIQSKTTIEANVSSTTTTTAPDIVGYTFSNWEAGDGVTITETNGKEVTFNAFYDGYLTAKYTKNSNIIYFYNTLGWENVYVYFYSGDYWDNNKGTGTKSGGTYKGHLPMVRMGESNIWYVNAADKATTYLVFGKDEQDNYDNFSDTEVIRRGDYNSSLPMFVPIADQTPTLLNKYTDQKGKDCVTKYYNKGYWMNYPENTGYTLDLFNHHSDNDPARYFIYPYSKNTIFPLQLEVEINAENIVDGDQKIWFRIHRNDGKNFGGHATNFPTVNPTTTGGFIAENDYKVELITPIAGTYTFILDYKYDETAKDYQYHIEVDYPAKVGDYRIIYKDNAPTNWSGTDRGTGWYHPSRVIKKGEDRKDIISFYINKDVERSLSYQTIKSINNETGAITWNTEEVPFMHIDWSQITKSGVYNFTFVQDGKGISVENDIVPYTGNYYIRTDAMGGGWEDYKTNSENRMTYSSFSESDANSFGEKFSHYAVKWCRAGTNVKFTIANDYSQCISDTLAQDVIPLGNLTDEGTLQNREIYDANIRFMWNWETNKISRAYVGPAGDKQSQFLMLRSCSEFKDAAGNDLDPNEGDILDKENDIYAARFTDTQNWIYERTIQVKPRTRVKLYASYPKVYHIYIENKTVWQDVALYAWKDGGDQPLGNWPGIQPTRTVEIEGKTYYDFQVSEYVFGSKLKFNNNNNGSETSAYNISEKGDYYLTASNSQLSFVKKVSTTVEATAQYFRGEYAEGSCADEHTIQILGGEGETWNTIRVIYDFKTNRLMAAWMPNNNEIDTERSIESDVMIIRDHQNAAQCITFANDESKLTNVKTVYGVMRFNRWILNNRGGEDNLDIESCTKVVNNQTVYDHDITNQNHPVLDINKQKSQYERALYFISFPFDVHLSDVFGFGTYGQHWIIEYYDGLKRAREGYWIDSDPNWKYVTNPTDFVLKAYEGYILCLNLGKMAYDNTDFWAHNISQVELFFPSFTTMEEISKIKVTMPSLGEEYLCKINRGDGTEGDRRVKDSYWRCIGVPSYANYSNVLKDEEGNDIRWQTSYKTFPFLYAWNMTDNTLTPQSTSNFPFKTMHAYLVQNGGEIHWSAVSATPEPASIVARKEAPSNNYEWKITLTRNEQVEDQAFVRLSDNEQVTTEFDFNQDLSKEFNYGRSDIYTLIGYEKAAANSLPISEQTTVIPLGLSIEYNGDYTLAMPDRVNGIGVTLVDNQTGTRTNLSAGMDYTLTLNKGDYNNRFFIEISPVQQVPTDIEYVTGDTNSQDTVRKVLIDNILYIVRDGQIFDARGARVK